MTHLRLTRAPTLPTDKAPEWLEVIWACDEFAPGMFVTDDITLNENWSPDCYMAEIYPDARVIFRKDDTVSIVSTTSRGDHALRMVATKRGIHFTP